MTRRETAALGALIDAVAAPLPPLPPVRDTDATAAFERWLSYAPAPNRTALRAALAGLAIARYPRKDRAARLTLLRRTGPLGEALRAAAAMSYYGDAGVLAALGHDPAARVREARAARHRARAGGTTAAGTTAVGGASGGPATGAAR
jgi:hypothetical protein